MENYWATVLQFSGLDRLERRLIGERFLEKMKKADNAGYGYGIAVLPDGTGVVLLATSEERHKRAKGQFNLCAAAYCGLGAVKVLGLATEPLSASSRSYEAICLGGVAFENSDELAAHFKNGFKKGEHQSHTEYGGRSSAG